ncbi:PQQ-binding-like beta-propeller repeat protein [Polymorphospora sp. 2-325]|uniref:PQQ-binding-like beta-propeller repeat protein n=1 Tax=Polymorphospora lycopeni TaxID=3140240 RepID=A0ABV5CVH1_9ACTN
MGIRRFVSSGPRWLRITAATALAAGVIAGTAAIAVRVLAPAEVSTTQAGPFPAASEQPGPGVRGVLTSAPLVVAGQLRIYAATRQVRADGPVDAKTERSPYWSYRRWPEQLVGVVVTGDTVVSRWSDGQLVGLDGLTGEVRWRTPGPEPIDSGYTGGRTGADIVYRPHGLHTANPPGGTPVLIAGNSTEVRGFDAATGRELWQARYDRPNCRATGFTTTGGAFLTVDVCATEEPPVELYDVTTGAMTRWQPEEARKPLQVTGVSCAAAASDCPAVRILSAGARRGWSTAGPTPVPVPALDPPTALVAGDTVVAPGDDPTTVVATSLDGGAPRWSRDVDTTAPPGTPAPAGAAGARRGGAPPAPPAGGGPPPRPRRSGRGTGGSPPATTPRRSSPPRWTAVRRGGAATSTPPRRPGHPHRRGRRSPACRCRRCACWPASLAGCTCWSPAGNWSPSTRPPAPNCPARCSPSASPTGRRPTGNPVTCTPKPAWSASSGCPTRATRRAPTPAASLSSSR